MYFVSGGARGKIKTIVLMQTILKRSSSPKHYENSVIKCSQRHNMTEVMEIDSKLLLRAPCTVSSEGSTMSGVSNKMEW